MLRFELTITGQDAVTNRLRAAAAKAPGAVGDAAYRWAQDVRGKLKSTPYPPQRPRQRYVRTGRLANSWQAQRVGTGRVLITNNAPYSGWVVGGGPHNRQAWFHAGRWWKGENVVRENLPNLGRTIVKEMDRLLK
jgi:hypothetical protein